MRHHDKAVRVLMNGETRDFYLRDLGGRIVGTVHQEMSFDGIDQLVGLAHKRYVGVPVVISAAVAQAVLDHALDHHRAATRPRMGSDTLAFNWMQELRGHFYRGLQALGYVTVDEYEAVRAIIDAGEVESVPEYLASLAAVKPAAKTG